MMGFDPSPLLTTLIGHANPEKRTGAVVQLRVAALLGVKNKACREKYCPVTLFAEHSGRPPQIPRCHRSWFRSGTLN